MKSSSIYQFLEEQESLVVDSDYRSQFGVGLEPAYLRMLNRIESFSYVFTSSSFNVLDLSFSLYHDFLYTSVSSYFDQLNNKIYIFIASGMAIPGPPLGTILAQHGIGTSWFCKEFNESTKLLDFSIIVRAILDWRPGIGGGSCKFNIEAPSASFFIGHCLDYYDISGSYLSGGFIWFSYIVQIAFFNFPYLELNISCSILVGTVLSMGATVRLDNSILN